MKNLHLIFAVASLALFACTQNSSTVVWTSTTNERPWQQKELSTDKMVDINAISIYTDQLEQKIHGFGACFNELGWEALNQLSEEEKQKIINDFFDPVNGCKYNLCRIPIGANDYAIDWYSHNETQGDFKMEHFNIERDKQRLIPYIHEAQRLQPDLKLWASPWCPPSWMKTNKHYACRPDDVNDLQPSEAGEEMITQFIMEPEYLKAYALYFSKFISAYQQEGISLTAVHVQNEPNSCQNFPSCVWRPEDLASFIGEYLGPRLSADHPETELWLGTIERPQMERIDPILQHREASKYIKGLGFQWAGKDAIPFVNQQYPTLQLMQTESECGNGSNDWAAAEHTHDLILHYLNNGANAYLYWNMVLNETGKSQWGWKQNSLITIDSATKAIQYNPEYYLMKHLSAFVEAGAFKIKTTDPNCLAFKNPDSIVVFYYNNGESSTRSFQLDKQLISTTLPAKSFNTFSIEL